MADLGIPEPGGPFFLGGGGSGDCLMPLHIFIVRSENKIHIANTAC